MGVLRVAEPIRGLGRSARGDSAVAAACAASVATSSRRCLILYKGHACLGSYKEACIQLMMLISRGLSGSLGPDEAGAEMKIQNS